MFIRPRSPTSLLRWAQLPRAMGWEGCKGGPPPGGWPAVAVPHAQGAPGRVRPVVVAAALRGGATCRAAQPRPSSGASLACAGGAGAVAQGACSGGGWPELLRDGRGPHAAVAGSAAAHAGRRSPPAQRRRQLPAGLGREFLHSRGSQRFVTNKNESASWHCTALLQSSCLCKLTATDGGCRHGASRQPLEAGEVGRPLVQVRLPPLRAGGRARAGGARRSAAPSGFQP